MRQYINSITRFIEAADTNDAFEQAKANCPAWAGSGPVRIEVRQLEEAPAIWRLTFFYLENEQFFIPTEHSALIGA